MIARFESEFDTFSGQLQGKLKRLFAAGIFDRETVNQAFADAGYTDLVNAWVDNYAEVITFNKQLANELGINFIITNETIKNFELIQGMDFDKLQISQELYATDMRKSALKYSLEGKSFKDVAFKTELEDILGTFKRRASAEAYTGIGIAESTIKKDWFEKAGIEKFVYVGPDEPGKNRAECRATLDDPRQSTGWTMEEINSSQTPFISCGGWNCRHYWLPFVEDLPNEEL